MQWGSWRRPWGSALLAVVLSVGSVSAASEAGISGENDATLNLAAIFVFDPTVTAADMLKYSKALGISEENRRELALLVTDDPAQDVAGKASAIASAVDITAAASVVVPAGNVTQLERVCAAPSDVVVSSCPAGGLPAGDLVLTLVAFGDGPLPDLRQLGPDESVYFGEAVNLTPDPADGPHDAFHEGTDGVVSLGLRADGFITKFNEGLADPAFSPFAAVFPTLGVAAIGTPLTLVKDGHVPFISIAGGSGGVADGTFDRLDTVLSPYGPPTLDKDLALQFGFVPDPGQASVVVTYSDAVGDRFATASDGSSSPLAQTDPFGSSGDLTSSQGFLVKPGTDAGPLLGQLFPCGQVNAAGALTVCAPGADVATGPLLVVVTRTIALVSTTGDQRVTHGVAFDGDGKPGTGWVARTKHDDPLQGTDRDYKLVRSGVQWNPVVIDSSQANGAAGPGPGGVEPGNATATSGFRAIVDGPSVTWLIPANEFTATLPGWRAYTTVTDDSGDDWTDVSSGGPGSTWQLQPLEDPLGLTVVHYAKPTVIGGCIVVTEFGSADFPVALDWTVLLGGIDAATAPTLGIGVTFPGGSASQSGVPVTDGVVHARTPVKPGKVAFESVTLEGVGKPADLRRSFQQVFGKSLRVTGEVGQQAGPDCP